MRKLEATPRRFAGAILALALLGAACAPDGDSNAAEDPAGDALSGNIVVSGSSTVEPVTVAVAEKFSAVQPDVGVSVTGPGTSDGFELFCNGETDISDASRAIAEEEIAACADAGIDFIELKVAIDGLSVITSTENDFIECVNFADIWALLGPESEGFDRWSDANQLGEQYRASGAPYPDRPLVITAPGEESGTHGSFIELTLEPFAEEAGLEDQFEDILPRPDYVASANDNVIVEGVAGTPSSLGWVGFAFFTANADVLKALEIDGGDGCVGPTPETIASFEYPISRPLFIYVNTQKLQENPALEAFVDFYLSDDGITSAEEVGYVPLDTDELAATRQVWESKETGTREGG
ncbi:MAG: phosphate ABC transporter substrate-binding protein PstS family protein [Actinomycetota bacterium]